MNISIKIGSALVIAAFAILGTACGGDSSGSPTVTVPTLIPTQINSFSVTGTSATVNDVAPINAGVNSGRFNVAWQAEATDLHQGRIYLSVNNSLETSTDVRILNKSCGTSSALAAEPCFTSANFNCQFKTDNKISCGVTTATNQEQDLTAFLNLIPFKGFLILDVCNGISLDCKSISHAVILQ